MKRRARRAKAISVGVCQCGDLVGFDLHDKNGAVFAHAHVDPYTAAEMIESLIRVTAEATAAVERTGKGGE